MSTKGLVVFNSAVDTLKSSAKNLEAIQAARMRLKQQGELLDNRKKESEIRLKNLELTGQGTALQNQMLKTQMDEYFKQQKAVQSGHQATIDLEEQNQTTQAKQAGQLAKAAYQSDPEVQLSVAQRVNPRLTVPGPEGGTVSGQMGYDMMDNTPEASSGIALGTITGKAGYDMVDNTPEAVDPAPLEPKYAGGKIVRFERAQASKEKPVTYNDIVKMAQQMAKDDTTSGEPLAQKIKKYIPEARKILTKSNVEEFNGPRTPGMTMDQVYKQDDPKVDREFSNSSSYRTEGITMDKVYRQDQKDASGFTIGEEKEFEGKGKYKYIGNDKWQRLK